MDAMAVNWESVGSVALWLAMGFITLAALVVAGFVVLLRSGGMVSDEIGGGLPDPFVEMD